MTEEKEYGFEEEKTGSPRQEDTFDPLGNGEHPHPPRAYGFGGKNPRPRIFLLVLLLVVLGAVVYLYYLALEEGQESSPPPAQVQRLPIAIPPKPEPTEAVPGQTAQQSPAAAPAAAPAPPVAAPAPPAPPVAAPAEKPSAEESSTVPVPAEAAISAPAKGNYTLDAGAFLLNSNQAAAEKAIRKLGFEPRWNITRQMELMTRLLVGTYPLAEARAKIAALADVAPDAFYLVRGDRTAVYAGSYYDLDQARRFADKLFEKGILVQEEQAEVPVSLKLVSFGNFPDLQAAQETAGRAKAAGLEVKIRKVR